MASDLCNLTFDEILCNNIALSYFIGKFSTNVLEISLPRLNRITIKPVFSRGKLTDEILFLNMIRFAEFMTFIGSQNMIMFHLHVEGFKTSAEQVAPGNRDAPSAARLQGSMQSLREAAQHIYNTYLSEQVSTT